VYPEDLSFVVLGDDDRRVATVIRGRQDLNWSPSINVSARILRGQPLSFELVSELFRRDDIFRDNDERDERMGRFDSSCHILRLLPILGAKIDFYLARKVQDFGII